MHVRPRERAVCGIAHGSGDRLSWSERLRPLAPRTVAIEATGGFETVVAAGLAGAGLPVAVVNPAQVRAFRAGARPARQERSHRCRRDRPLCAKRRSRSCGRCRTTMTRLLAALVARRRQIVEMLAAEGQRSRRASERSGEQEHRPPVQGAGEGACRTGRRHRRSGARLAGLAREGESARSPFPASGTVIARTLIAEMPELGSPRSPPDRSPRRPCALHPPVRPMEGQELHRRRSQNRAHAPCSSAAMVAASASTRRSRSFRDKLVASGKPKLVALVAVARKLLTILNAILRDKTPWQPQNA